MVTKFCSNMKCKHKDINYSWVTFKNGTRHVAKKCTECSKHLGFEKREFVIGESIAEGKTNRERDIELGKPVGCRVCFDECRVGISGFCIDCERSDDAKTLRLWAGNRNLSIFDLSREQIFEALE